MSKKIIVLILMIISFGLGGCVFNKELFVFQSCPPDPIYPKISDSDLIGISDKTYNSIVDMVSMRDEYINELKVFCKER